MLQVDPDAEPEVIEAAYKRLAAKYHPDKNPSESAPARMKEINAAYDVLKYPERHARYDRQQASVRPPPPPEPEDDDDEDEDDEPPPRYNRSQRAPVPPTVEQVSNSVVKKLLGVGAVIALLVYLPWLAAVVAGLWGAVWLFKKYPGPIGKILWLTVAITVAVVVRFVWTDWERDKQAKEELAALDLPTILAEQLNDFTTTCTTKASKKNSPALAAPYCTCLAEVIRTRFDMSPIHVESVYDYNQVVSTRFSAAAPDDDAKTDCAEQVRTKSAISQHTNGSGR